MYKDIEDQEILYMIEENNDNYELIYEKYKPLIITICQKRLNSMKGMGYELDDLVQVANMAVFEAVKTYKYDNDTKFYTYLSHCVNNALNLLLRNNLTNKLKYADASKYEKVMEKILDNKEKTIEDETVRLRVLEAYRLLVEEGKTITEIATILDSTENTIYRDLTKRLKELSEIAPRVVTKDTRYEEEKEKRLCH